MVCGELPEWLQNPDLSSRADFATLQVKEHPRHGCGGSAVSPRKEVLTSWPMGLESCWWQRSFFCIYTGHFKMFGIQRAREPSWKTPRGCSITDTNAVVEQNKELEAAGGMETRKKQSSALDLLQSKLRQWLRTSAVQSVEQSNRIFN